MSGAAQGPDLAMITIAERLGTSQQIWLETAVASGTSSSRMEECSVRSAEPARNSLRIVAW